MFSSVGLVLRPQAVEVAEATRGFGGGRVGKTARAAAQVGEDTMSQAIRSALDRAQVRPRQVAVSVPSQEVLLRFFTMPLLPKAEWRSAIQFEVRKYIPFKIEELVWVFHVSEQKLSRQMRVAFMGIRSERLSRIQRWLEGAGVRASRIEAHAVSLSRLAPKLPNATDNDFTVIVEVEPDAAHIVIAQPHVPYFARDINLTHVVGEAAPGIADSRPERLQSELWLSMDFFKRELPAAAIRQVVFFGEEPALASWCAGLSAQLGCPVVVGRLPVTYAPTAMAPCISAVSLTLPSSVRTAFDFQAAGVMKAAKPKVIPAKMPDASVLSAMAGPAVWQAVLAGLALCAYAVWEHQGVSTARAELARKVESFPKAGWQLQGRPMEELQPLKDAAEQRLTQLRGMVQRRVSVTKKLDALSRTLPDGIWLDHVTYRDPMSPSGDSEAILELQGACFLSGAGNEVDTISGFAQRVKQEPAFIQGFTTSQLGEIAQTTDNIQQQTYWTFHLTSEAARRGY